LTECTVTANQGTFCGGVQVIDNTSFASSQVAMVDCIIEGNLCTYPVYGIGGVSLYDGQTTMSGCTVRDNQGGGLGGVFINGEATATIADTTVCGNLGYEGDTTQISGDFTDAGGNIIEDVCIESCAGDLDGDGAVTVDDLLTLLSAFESDGDGDCDDDGDTDVNDLLILIGVWGPCNA
jgi:hypothetical protein